MKEAAAAAQLLERSEELARIESALAEARSGRGTFVVIEGPAGIGKTALLAAARTAAADGGMRVLRSRGTELERDFAFGVVRQLFEPPLAEASELERADLLQGAAGVAARAARASGRSRGGRPASSGVDPSFAILHGLYWLCANLAAAGPLCFVVDDAHWADAAVASLPGVPAHAARRAGRRARRRDPSARGGHRCRAACERDDGPVR